MAAPDVNTQFLDALVRHQIYLMRYSGSLRDDLLKLLDATDADLSAAILRRLEGTKGYDTLSASRLRVLKGIVDRIRGDAWDQVDEVWLEQLTELAKTEVQFTDKALKTVAPVVLDTAIPSNAQLKAIVTSKPFEGRVLEDWASDVRKRDLDLIMKQIQIGMVQNETAPEIARRVVGMGGVTELTRRNVEAVTRTAVNFVSNTARQEFIQANTDIVSQEKFVATLDSRTTLVCASNDGKLFDVGDGPQPPLHFNCRSTRVPYIDGAALGDRPMKNSTEQMLAEEYSMGEYSSRDDVPYGEKGAFDLFAAARVRELTGTVPSNVTYADWLERQSKQFQDDVLGPTRAALFRDGGLELDRFVNRRGDQVPLHQLMLKNKQAFIDAGLDPKDF